MTNRDRLMKALWLCEDIPYSVYKEVVLEQIGRTGDKKSPRRCEQCKHYRIKVRPGGGWMEVCEVNGERIICNISDDCLLMEVKNV